MSNLVLHGHSRTVVNSKENDQHKNRVCVYGVTIGYVQYVDNNTADADMEEY